MKMAKIGATCATFLYVIDLQQLVSVAEAQQDLYLLRPAQLLNWDVA